MFGNWGRVLEIDLMNDARRIHEIGGDVLSRSLGGSALATELLWNRWSELGAALSATNALVLATGPLQASTYPGSAKWVAVSRSPLTGTICVSAAGGRFGSQLKRAGFDALILSGRASAPAYVLVRNHEASLRDATHLWGRDSYETTEALAQEHSDLSPSILTIGPAAEHQVSIACLVADGHSFAGRGGLGAVLGSKNVKAVVVSGGELPEVAEPPRVGVLAKQAARKLREATRDTLNKHGTVNDLIFFDSIGDFPVKYWSGDSWPSGAEKLGAPRFTELLHARPQHCFACPIGCHRHIDFHDGHASRINGPGPEYESLGLLGGACLVDDLRALARANDRCNRLGIDTVSAGAFVAFAMQCKERNLLGENASDQMPLAWGDASSLLTMIEQIGNRTGLGELFARGIRHAAASLGQEASDLAVEVKGMDLPAHDPRAFFSLALNYATSPQGACHLRGFPHVGELQMTIPEVGYTRLTERFSMDGKAHMVKIFQDYAVVLDSLVECCFMQISGLSLTETVEALNAITGAGYTVASLMKVGERGFNMQRLFNVQDGYTRADDRLPLPLLTPATAGPRAGRTPAEGYSGALSEYYALRGWSEAGIPKKEKLDELEISEPPSGRFRAGP